MSVNIGEYAVQAAELGLFVVPLGAMSKVPWLKNWQTEASNDPLVIAQWWAERPNSNYGIATGFDNLFLVDMDGSEAVSWWKAQNFQPGAEVYTPSGGLHVWYRSPDGVDIQTNAGKVHKGVDIRGVGGQAVGPGSVTAKGYYRGSIEAIASAPEAPPRRRCARERSPCRR